MPSRIDDCRLMIVDRRCELGPARPHPSSSHQKSTIIVHQSSIHSERGQSENPATLPLPDVYPMEEEGLAQSRQGAKEEGMN
jgi:hypothetical protein